MTPALFRCIFAFLFVASAPAYVRAQTPQPLAASTPLQLALTFDDLPAHGPLPPGEPRPAVVRSILATLKSDNLPPVYGFINGFRVARFPYQRHILQAWEAAGQPLGNHTFSHPELDLSSAAAYTRNIARNEPLLSQLQPSADWHWFRYPYLEEGDTLAKRDAVRSFLFAHHYRVAEISMDFQDYQWNDAYARCATQHNASTQTEAETQLHDTYLAAAAAYATHYREVAQQLYSRDIPYILLMHVGAFDAKMLPELLAQYRAEGFEFITLEQASADPAYAEDPHVPSKGGATFTEMVAARRNLNITPGPDFSAQLAALCHP